jgi:hypothetical protein
MMAYQDLVAGFPTMTFTGNQPINDFKIQLPLCFAFMASSRLIVIYVVGNLAVVVLLGAFLTAFSPTSWYVVIK